MCIRSADLAPEDGAVSVWVVPFKLIRNSALSDGLLPGFLDYFAFDINGNQAVFVSSLVEAESRRKNLNLFMVLNGQCASTKRHWVKG